MVRDAEKAPLPSELAWAFAHSGNYVAIAAAIGFRGSDDDGAFLHSHIAAVLPGWQGSSVGFALKPHQPTSPALS